MRFSFVLTACLASLASSTSLQKQSSCDSPSVELQIGTVIGSSASGVDSFKGIPFAQPPIDNLRLRAPQPITTHLGSIHATGIPQSCPQRGGAANASSPYSSSATITSGENCLTLNVQRPSSANATSKLPVLFWMSGGAFVIGDTQLYDGTQLVSMSAGQGKDIIYVQANYRVFGFGFLAGKEILQDGAANLGLLDQRLALQWVADNIAALGGDPEKVTIWGESAGSISVFDQMALYGGNYTYKGKPLFRGGIMDSGSIVPANPVNAAKPQAVYDFVVSSSGCSNATNTLSCLRSLPYATLFDALSQTSSNFGTFLPRPDGLVLPESPEILAQKGRFANIPFIIGDQEDEGTGAAVLLTNISTTQDVVNYLYTNFLYPGNITYVQGLVDTYPNNASAGSPFGTGSAFEIYPQYKRLSAVLGDYTFTLTRRVFLALAQAAYPSTPSWSYLATYGSTIPVLGTYHGSDVAIAYGQQQGIPQFTIQSYYINFVNSGNPNLPQLGLGNWTTWSEGKELMNFGALSSAMMKDDFRERSFEYLKANLTNLRL